MQMKRRESIEKADLSSLSHLMRNEIESLYKLNKVKISEVLFHTLMGINLRLHNSSANYLKGVLEVFNSFLRAAHLLILSKEQDELRLYFLNLRNLNSYKSTSKSSELLKMFDQLASAPATKVLTKEMVAPFVRQMDCPLSLDEQSVLQTTKLSRVNRGRETPVLGLYFFPDSGDELLEKSAKQRTKI